MCIKTENMAELGTVVQILVAKAQNRQVAMGPILGSLLTWLLLYIAMKIYSVNNIFCIYETEVIVICMQFPKAKF